LLNVLFSAAVMEQRDASDAKLAIVVVRDPLQTVAWVSEVDLDPLLMLGIDESVESSLIPKLDVVSRARIERIIFLTLPISTFAARLRCRLRVKTLWFLPESIAV
jgi:hypothetical protein